MDHHTQFTAGKRLQGRRFSYLVLAKDESYVWVAQIQINGQCEVVFGKVKVTPVSYSELQNFLAK